MIALLLDQIRDEGVEIELAPDGKNLKLTGPAKLRAIIAERIRRDKAKIVAHLRGRAAFAPGAADTAPSLSSDGLPSAAATIILAECNKHGIGLRVDDDVLVVTSNGRAWKALITMIEAHIDELVDLLINDPQGSIKAAAQMRTADEKA